ncbi:hypothetical protein [Colwellia psychrerythraea]|uniref:Uncharacterized protein n=1 Tax=Colwellia psychrerythraea TaxID=28229 RepID=A0A099KRV3_COLPS|nr:hypothetical protein [Colwellia psychrerythraea]KGJ92398.1 hypothetical protein ND2E_3010 [Colwellia psychrerythraea]
MPKTKIKENNSSFAELMSAAFASGFATSTINNFEVNYSLFLATFDIFPALVHILMHRDHLIPSKPIT